VEEGKADGKQKLLPGSRRTGRCPQSSIIGSIVLDPINLPVHSYWRADAMFGEVRVSCAYFLPVFCRNGKELPVWQRLGLPPTDCDSHYHRGGIKKGRAAKQDAVLSSVPNAIGNSHTTSLMNTSSEFVNRINQGIACITCTIHVVLIWRSQMKNLPIQT
jgi:hypothetical protein